MFDVAQNQFKIERFSSKKKFERQKKKKKKKSELELRKQTCSMWPKISLKLKYFPPKKKKKRLKSLPQIYLLLLLLFIVKSEAKRWVKGV